MNCAAEDIDLRAELGLRIHRLYSDDRMDLRLNLQQSRPSGRSAPQ
jgi:hypothetical protein